MAAARVALLLSSSERHIVTAINFFATMIIARLVAPAEFGIFVLGASVMALAEVIRDLGTSSYLVQQQELSIEKTRTAFTIVLVLTIAAAVLILMSVEVIATYYALPGLKHYLQVSVMGFLLGPFVSPVHSLLRRDLRFGAIATTNVTTSLLNAAVVVLLATLGFSYMSFAWANVASGIAGLALLLFFRPDVSIFRPSLAALRNVVSFGAYDSFAEEPGHCGRVYSQPDIRPDTDRGVGRLLPAGRHGLQAAGADPAGGRQYGRSCPSLQAGPARDAT